MKYNISWYGRGGQGLVVAAQIAAEAAYIEGFKGVTSAPQFGPERRGAPLTASTRIASEKIRVVSQIKNPDFAVVLDSSLLEIFNIAESLKESSTIIINTQKSPQDFKEYSSYRVAVCDASKIASDSNLIKDGKFITNTPMLGAFAKASNLISISSLEKVLSKKFSNSIYKVNFMALESAYEKTAV